MSKCKKSRTPGAPSDPYPYVQSLFMGGEDKILKVELKQWQVILHLKDKD